MVPIPFIFGRSALAKIALAVNRALARLRPTLFGFQILLVVKPRPTLATLLEAAERSAKERVFELSDGGIRIEA